MRGASSRLFAIVPALVLALAIDPPRSARAEWDRNTFISSSWRVEMVIPPDWERSEQASYPGILAYAIERQGGGRLTLAVEQVEPIESAKSYAERNRVALRRAGFRVGALAPHPTGALLLDSDAPDRRRRIRQAYAVHAGTAYVLTLAASADAMRSYGRAFDETMRSLAFKQAPPATAPALPPESVGP